MPELQAFCLGRRNEKGESLITVAISACSSNGLAR